MQPLDTPKSVSQDQGRLGVVLPPHHPSCPLRRQKQRQDLPTAPNGMAETEGAGLTGLQLTHRSALHPTLLSEPEAGLEARGSPSRYPMWPGRAAPLTWML